MQLNNQPDKRSKNYIYHLMKELVKKEISPRKFCNEFYECFDLNIDLNLLSEVEKKQFESLSDVAGRFSEFQEDIDKFPKAYSDEKELRKKVGEVCTFLKSKKSSRRLG